MAEIALDRLSLDELRALGRSFVERIAAIDGMGGLAEDEQEHLAQQANAVLAEIHRRRVTHG